MLYIKTGINRILNNIYIPPRLFIENNIINLSNNEDINRIIDRLYISNISTAMNEKILDENNIIGIVSCISHDYIPLKKRTYRFINCYDDEGFDISQYFDECGAFINSMITTERNVLVHCMYGKSRSVAIVIAYLIKYKGMTCMEALEMVRLARNVAHPNDYFMKQLQDYELINSGVVI